MIIGFSGPKGVGKDLAFKIIQRNYQHLYDIKKIAFADPIKNFLKYLFENQLNESRYDYLKRVPQINLIDQTTNQTLAKISGRRLVREIGMMMRNLDDQQFVRYVRQNVIDNPDTIFICTDVRFDNEVDLINDELHGKIALIERPGYQYDGHVSEQKIKHHDAKINNTTQDNFEQQICKFFEKCVASN